MTKVTHFLPQHLLCCSFTALFLNVITISVFSFQLAEQRRQDSSYQSSFLALVFFSLFPIISIIF